MRRYDESDEVDIVIVGCGAGGATLAQRLARAGWRVVALRRGPVLGSGNRLGERRARFALALLDRSATDQRRESGAVGFEQLRARRRRIDGALRRLHAALSSVRLRHLHQRRSGRRLAHLATTNCGRTTSRSSTNCQSPVSHWPWGDPHSYPFQAQPVSGNGDVFISGCERLGIPVRVGPVAIANGRFGNRPHCIYRGFCLQGCKVNAKASPLITHVPDALAHGAEIRAHSHVSSVLVDEQQRPGDRRHLFQGRRRATAACAHGRHRWRTRSKPHACCCCRHRSDSRTVSATTRARSATTSWCKALRRPRVASTPKCECTRGRRPK